MNAVQAGTGHSSHRRPLWLGALVAPWSAPFALTLAASVPENRIGVAQRVPMEPPELRPHRRHHSRHRMADAGHLAVVVVDAEAQQVIMEVAVRGQGEIERADELSQREPRGQRRSERLGEAPWTAHLENRRAVAIDGGEDLASHFDRLQALALGEEIELKRPGADQRDAGEPTRVQQPQSGRPVAAHAEAFEQACTRLGDGAEARIDFGNQVVDQHRFDRLQAAGRIAPHAVRQSVGEHDDQWRNQPVANGRGERRRDRCDARGDAVAAVQPVQHRKTARRLGRIGIRQPGVEADRAADHGAVERAVYDAGRSDRRHDPWRTASSHGGRRAEREQQAQAKQTSVHRHQRDVRACRLATARVERAGKV